MTDRCYRHPQRNVVATCRYCGRHLCDECLVHNKKAKYYSCKDTQGCLAFQEGQSGSGDAYMEHHKTLIKDLDKDIHRLAEIMERMGEIGAVFEQENAKTSPQSESDALLYIENSVNKVRIPGFIAYHLAQEGLCLLHVLAISCAIGKQLCGGDSEKFDGILKYIDEVEPGLRQAAHDMEPYVSKNPIGALSSQIAERRR